MFDFLALGLLSVYASFLLSMHKTALTSARNFIIFRPLLTYNSINRRAMFLIFLIDKQHGRSTTPDIIKFNFYPYNNFLIIHLQICK